jgi:HK97 family phage prohead protease
MNDISYRSFTPDLEVRSDGDGRTIRGIVVPYGKAVRIDARLVEQFARGAFNHQLRAASRVKVAREHMDLGGSLIGRASLLRDDAAGLYAELRVSATPVGDETLALVRDGALTDLSIGFREGRNRNVAGGITERVKAHLAEVAVVMAGAYGELATVSGVRSQGAWYDEDVAAVVSRLDEARQILASLPVLPLS